MTIEEKARAYDEAIKVAKEWHIDAQIGFKANLETLFPELKESEDERIRKEIINYINNMKTTTISDIKEKQFESWIAWLEKQESVGEIVSRCKASWFNEGKIQGQIERLSDEETYQQGWHDALEKQSEQKSADKVEPKFKVGDWCIDNEDGAIFQIVKVLDNTYTYKTNEGKEYSCTHYSLENDAKLWTIQDAKDSEVLVSKHNQPFIYNGIFDEESVGAYCGIDSLGDDFLESTFSCDWSYKEGVKPATKEQCDFLFQKMKETGYEWDAEKKELKKIENVPEKHKKQVMHEMTDLFKDCIRLNPAWSEEEDDDAWMNDIISKVENNLQLNKAEIDWLKSLKEKIIK